MIRIPFNRPQFVGREQEYLLEALAGGHTAGDGPFTARAQQLLERELGSGKILLTTSCTHALELAALLLDIRPGDEVIVPDFTFVSTANAFVLRGARTRFADIRPDTLNLDEERLEALIGPKTRAIVPVHYAGVGCEMPAILDLAKKHGLAVVEDNAHGLFARKAGRFLGTFGEMATLSFHETKNFFCGEGGALIVNEPALVERAEIIREKGTNRKRFLRGLVDKYTWVDIGSSLLPSDLLAAILVAQLERREWVLEQRRALYERYLEALTPWAASHDVRLPFIPADCESSYHMFYAVLPTADARDRLIDELRARDILAVFHYVPLSQSAMGRALSPEDDCPVTRDVASRLVRLPFYTTMTREEQDEVIAAVTAFVP